MNAKTLPALAGQVEPSVRPAAWVVRQGMRTYYVSDAEFVRSSYDTGSFTPLYGPDALAAERERWRVAAQKAEDALTWAHGGEPLPTLEREALDLLRPLLRA